MSENTIAVPGYVIAQIINELGPIIEKYPRSHVIMAGLTLAILIQNPDLTPAEMHEIVMGASQYIVTALEMMDYTVPTSDIPKHLLN